MNKSKVTNSLRGILYGLHFLAPFIFLLLLSIGTRSTLYIYIYIYIYIYRWEGIPPSGHSDVVPMSE